MNISKQNAVITYIALIFIWASTPLAIVWSVDTIAPMWSMVLRFFLALPLTLGLVWLMKIQLPFTRQTCLSYLAGSLSLIVSQTFTYLATAHLSSSIIAMVFGMTPVITGLVGAIWFSVQLRALQWLGMFVALAGLSSMCLLAQESMHFNVIGIFLVLASVTIYCFSMYFVKQINAPVTPFAQASGSIIFSTIIAIGFIPFIWDQVPTTMPSLKSISALLFTAVVASIVAMFCYFKLIQNISATTLSLTTVMTPIIALILGAVLNQEYLSMQVYFGIVVIFIGLLIYFYHDIQRMLRERIR